MLQALYEAERELPSLLEKEDGWQSLDVDYHAPRVERVWRQWGEYRLCLHVIHQCSPDASLFHPHPWPSAMRVLSGIYEMEIGYGKGLERPPVACKMQTLIAPGTAASTFEYEMTDPDGWHSVRPLTSVCHSVMLSGKPWGRETDPASKTLSSLSPTRVAEILRWYQEAPWYRMMKR